jgi:porin
MRSVKMKIIRMLVAFILGAVLGASPLLAESPEVKTSKNYVDEIWTSPTFSDSWLTPRKDLAEKGITFDTSVTQVLQGGLDGGKNRHWRYGGRADYIMNVDTGKMGLWRGGYFKVHGETQFGRDVNGQTGAFMPVNTVALYPMPSEELTCLSEVIYTQVIIPEFIMLAGKIEPRETNVFAGNETEQFMNTAFVFNPIVGRTLPLDFLGAGVVFTPVKWLSNTTLVLDAEGNAAQSGFDTVFRRGTTVFNKTEADVKPFGLAGHQRVSFTTCDKNMTLLHQDFRAILKEKFEKKDVVLEKQSGDWCLMYDFDQYIYTVKDHPDRGFGLFGRYGVSSGRVNPIEAFYSLGLGGKGMIPTRPEDTFGVGYYYLGTANDLYRVKAFKLNNEQGVELYYNIKVTPWMQITPDLQIINPASKVVKTAVVAGIRTKLIF